MGSKYSRLKTQAPLEIKLLDFLYGEWGVGSKNNGVFLQKPMRHLSVPWKRSWMSITAPMLHPIPEWVSMNPVSNRSKNPAILDPHTLERQSDMIMNTSAMA